MGQKRSDDWGAKDERDYQIQAKGKRRKQAFDEDDQIVVAGESASPKSSDTMPAPSGAKQAANVQESGTSKNSTKQFSSMRPMVIGGALLFVVFFLVWWPRPSAKVLEFNKYIAEVCIEQKNFGAPEVIETAKWAALKSFCDEHGGLAAEDSENEAANQDEPTTEPAEDQ